MHYVDEAVLLAGGTSSTRTAAVPQPLLLASFLHLVLTNLYKPPDNWKYLYVPFLYLSLRSFDCSSNLCLGHLVISQASSSSLSSSLSHDARAFRMKRKKLCPGNKSVCSNEENGVLLSYRSRSIIECSLHAACIFKESHCVLNNAVTTEHFLEAQPPTLSFQRR